MSRSCTAVRAARRLGLSAALLAASVLGDSAVEHYRGSFRNRAMYIPLASAAFALGAGLLAARDSRPKRDGARSSGYAAAAAVGLAGLGFHAYNVIKRPGGMSWLNLFYAAPLGAPIALTLAGVLGLSAEKVREEPQGCTTRILGLPAERAVAGITSAGIVGTAAEAALLHFRGAYHNPAMALPVTVPPVGAALLAWAGSSSSPRVRALARVWLKLTALVGAAGAGFHAYGVSRNMGGWRNWSQNVLNGPPIPAPPSFAALAVAGLAALSLRNPRP
jgi:hypothetical protein